PERELHALDLTEVQLRALTPAEIERYLDAEPALDCAGSFKCEGLGISLFDAIRSQDPTALVGLPLIALARLLREAGFHLP
ncbi:septum formation inhibitor Maf, partial [Xanthomonas oryzae pv. oryzae]